MGNLINLGKEETAKLPNGNNYKRVYSYSTAYSALTTILDISGSGFLKSAFNAAQQIGYAQIKITIDGTVILNLNNTVANLDAFCSQGIVDVVGRYSSSMYLPIVSLTTLSNSSLSGVRSVELGLSTEQPCEAFGGIFVIPELLLFEKSLKVEVKKQQTDTYSIIEYYLD